MNTNVTGVIRQKLSRSALILIASAFALSGLMPILLSAKAGAAQVTSRRVTISTSQSAATGVSYAFNFTLPTGTDPIQSIAFSFCTTPLGTCTLPNAMNVGTTAVSVNGTQTFSQAGTFAEVTSVTGGCTGVAANNTATQYCVSRTAAGNESAAAKAITLDGITNPTIASGNNLSVYVRMAIYSDDSFATQVHEGTVAASIINQLTVTGRIQERLVFCVFALTDAAGSGTVGTGAGEMPTDCASTEANASTNVDIGVIDNSAVVTSPVDNNPPTALGNDRFGAAIVNTNASSGVAVTYYATAAGTGTNELRAFRVAGASCDVSGTSLVDQCFVSANESTGEAFTAGTERFGVQIACVANSTTTAGAIGTTSNLGKNSGGSYTSGSGTGGSFNSVYDAGQSSLDDTAGDDCETDPSGTTLNEEFGWNDTSTAQALLSSTTVVDDELVKLRFGAAASSTTPTGTYTVASTYIATPTF